MVIDETSADKELDFEAVNLRLKAQYLRDAQRVASGELRPEELSMFHGSAFRGIAGAIKLKFPDLGMFEDWDGD